MTFSISDILHDSDIHCHSVHSVCDVLSLFTGICRYVSVFLLTDTVSTYKYQQYLHIIQCLQYMRYLHVPAIHTDTKILTIPVILTHTCNTYRSYNTDTYMQYMQMPAIHANIYIPAHTSTYLLIQDSCGNSSKTRTCVCQRLYIVKLCILMSVLENMAMLQESWPPATTILRVYEQSLNHAYTEWQIPVLKHCWYLLQRLLRGTPWYTP